MVEQTTNTQPAPRSVQYGDIVEFALKPGQPAAVYFVAYVDDHDVRLVPQDHMQPMVRLVFDEHRQLKTNAGDIVPTLVLLDRKENEGYVQQNGLEDGQTLLLQVVYDNGLVPVRGKIVAVDPKEDVVEFQPEDTDLGAHPLLLEFRFHGLPVWIDHLEILPEEAEETEANDEEDQTADTLPQMGGSNDNNPSVAKENPKPKPEPAAEEPEEEVTFTPDQFVPEIVKRVPPEILHPTIFKPAMVEASYILPSREKFVQFIQAVLTKEQLAASNRRLSSGTQLLEHQALVRNYMNLYTPYRGLLLYHGLGAGKTCTSIAIAEGMKSSKKVFVLTPASLRWNYMEELKKCADVFYKRQQFWEWINAADVSDEVLRTIAALMQLPVTHIKSQGGIWFIHVQQPSNYDQLTRDQQLSLERQLNFMIERKYKFLHYNGLTQEKFAKLTQYGRNPFDHAVVIVDEAHNLVTRIANKMVRPAEDQKVSLAQRLYDLLLRAEDCRIVLLTGTPLINYPHELGVLFNLLRGYIRTWRLTLDTSGAPRRPTQEAVRAMLQDVASLDYVEYSAASRVLTVTRNPYAFVTVRDPETKKPTGVALASEEGDDLDSTGFVTQLTQTLRQHSLGVQRVELELKKALPDNLEEFLGAYVDDVALTLKNEEAFKRRIVGLTSYFQEVEDKGMPDYHPKRDFHVVRLPMSGIQFAAYRLARLEEMELEKRRAKRRHAAAAGGLYAPQQATFRIFSRLVCNFFIPDRVKPLQFRGAASQSLPKDSLPLQRKRTQKIRLEKVSHKRSRKARDEATEEEELDDQEHDQEEQDQDKEEKLEQEGEEEKEKPEESVEEPLRAEEPDLSAELTGELEGDQALQQLDQSYAEALKEQLRSLEQDHPNFFVLASDQHPQGQLAEYSPKAAALLTNVQDPGKQGCHLVYSQFRQAEGIGLMAKVLLANGYTEFKVKKQQGIWYLDCTLQYPMFALYTGTEDDETKEMVRRIFNSEWEEVPSEIRDTLEERFANRNVQGQVIQCLMITSSGSEGITLKHVKWVHLFESYWHGVRLQQVIGRTRRIGSHDLLPEEERHVEVFLYLAVMTAEQKRTLGESQTTDEYLRDIAERKATLNGHLLRAVQESAFDCFLHDKQKRLRCLNFEADDADFRFSYVPDYSKQNADGLVEANQVQEEVVSEGTVTVGAKKFAYKTLRQGTVQLFDLPAFQEKRVVKVGQLRETPDGQWRLVNP